jgi:FkbM family methyltransferase
VSLDTRGLLRTGLTYVPWLAEYKNRSFYWLLRLIQRPFEVEFHALQPYVNPRTTFLDVGANYGQSIDAIRMMQRHVRVIALEPNPLLLKLLVRRFDQHARTTVLGVAAGSTDRIDRLYVPKYNGYAFDGAASTVSEIDAAQWLTTAIRNFDPAKLSIDVWPVHVRRLDDIAARSTVDVMKLDVQGSELDALRGATRILSTDRPLVMVEQSAPCEIDRFMATKDYEPWAWRSGPGRAGRLHRGIGQLNTIYLPREGRRRT